MNGLRVNGSIPMFRLLIVDDHPIVLTGLKLLLDGDLRFAIHGEANSAAGACSAAERLMPDAIITDLVMADHDGIALIEDLCAIVPGVRILVYSSRDESLWAPRAVRAGAHGFIAKSEPLDAVATGLVRVMTGAIHVSEPVQQRLMGDGARRCDRARDVEDLSARERQVLRLVGSGATLQEMARELTLSVKTIGTYRERLKVKLGLDSARGLERYAADHVADRHDLL